VEPLLDTPELDAVFGESRRWTVRLHVVPGGTMLMNLSVLVVSRDGEERELLEIFLRELALYVAT
jgi:hypothetical protein